MLFTLTSDIHSVNRAEVSQKAAEVDALHDRLTEEKKRSRDLQWAMEKERCETGRNEERKREELEVWSSHTRFMFQYPKHPKTTEK